MWSFLPAEHSFNIVLNLCPQIVRHTHIDMHSYTHTHTHTYRYMHIQIKYEVVKKQTLKKCYIDEDPQQTEV